MQEIRVWSLVREDPTSCRATEPVSRNYWACAPGSGSHNYWAHTWQLLKPMHPRACALQQEGPLQEEALELQWRVAPTHRSERKVPAQQWRPRTARSKNWTKKKKKKDNHKVDFQSQAKYKLSLAPRGKKIADQLKRIIAIILSESNQENRNHHAD